MSGSLTTRWNLLTPNEIADAAGPGNVDDHRSVLKNARMSATSTSGSSRAAKCPPRSTSVQRVIVFSASANRRMPTSWANTIAAVGIPLLVFGAPHAALCA